MRCKCVFGRSDCSEYSGSQILSTRKHIITTIIMKGTKSTLSFSIDRILERVQQNSTSSNTTTKSRLSDDTEDYEEEISRRIKPIVYLRHREPAVLFTPGITSTDEEYPYHRQACYCRDKESLLKNEKKANCLCQDFLVKKTSKKGSFLNNKKKKCQICNKFKWLNCKIQQKLFLAILPEQSFVKITTV